MSNPDELLVFGYSCKLFRDDEKAFFIDQSKHLVPWMNDPSLLIDRFDVRGALYDLTDAESKGSGLEELTEAEQREEYICDQERYFYLYHDDTQQTFQEEEIKRLQVDLDTNDSLYKQVGFDYNFTNDNQQAPQEGGEVLLLPQHPTHYKPIVEEAAYFPPPELNVPNGMEVPQTVKQNKIIIKTAKFIVTHGAQMEIVIKTKQAGNSFFNFLSFEHPLNSYYKHVVFMLRMGKYKWEEEIEMEPSKEEDSQYLHPDLSQSVRPDLTPGVSSPQSASPHCSYSKLITKIREKQIASGWEDSEVASPANPSSPIVHSNVDVTADKIPLNSNANSIEPSVSLVDYPSFTHAADGTSDVEEESSPVKKQVASKSSFLRMKTHDYSGIKWPPPEEQMVIDKMASYIIKNGSAFEEVVRNRNDPRFEFLKPYNEFHPYYQCKIQLYNEVYGDFFKSSSKIQESKKSSHKLSLSKRDSASLASNNNRAISFSIKSREQEVSLSNNSTFPIESSTSEEDEDMDEEERERRRVERERRYQAKKKEEKERKEHEDALRREKLRKMKREIKKPEKVSDEETSGNEDLYDIFKYAQEMESERSRLGQIAGNSTNRSQVKQLERKKKAAAFISKINIKGGKKEKAESTVYGPALPPEADGSLPSCSPLQSPPSSRSSSEESSSKASSIYQTDSKAVPPPPPSLPPPLPPPPASKSPPSIGLTEAVSASLHLLNDTSLEFSNKVRNSQEKWSAKPIPESIEESNLTREGSEEHGYRSRSRRKHSRQRSSSKSPSGRKEKKKQKRSHGRSHHRKKQRSRSRSKSKSKSKSHRSSHKKKSSKHSSHKDKSKKKKHRKHRSASSSSRSSSLSASSRSGAASPSTPSLVFDSNSDMDVQVIDSKEAEQISSRSSSVVSLPSTSQKSTNSPNICDEGGGSSQLSVPPAMKNNALSLITAEESTSSSIDASNDMDKKSSFDPSTSNAVAKITQGLRAKLQALLEK